MRSLPLTMVLCTALLVLGCGETSPAPETLPQVTLTERSPKGSTLLLRFRLSKLDRVDWTNKLLRAQVVKGSAKPIPAGPKIANPGPEFTIKVLVGKPTETEKVLFSPTWGKSQDGIITETVPFDLEGTPDGATVPKSKGRRLAQILQTCTGPNRTIPFDPNKGVDLVTVGYGEDAHSLKVWVQTVTTKRE